MPPVIGDASTAALRALASRASFTGAPVRWDYIGIILGILGLYWGYIGVVLGFFWIMESKMETTTRV